MYAESEYCINLGVVFHVEMRKTTLLRFYCIRQYHSDIILYPCLPHFNSLPFAQSISPQPQTHF